jgi:EmrB/QacA subfamily drug resistance transporter
MIGPHRLPCETPDAHAFRAHVQGEPSRWILPATILGSSLSFIDGSVVNVAMPAMQRDFHAPLATMQWVANGYMLMLASLILLGGSAGDRFGRRRMYLVGLAGFTAASLACGLATGPGWLIVARVVQGTAAALLVPGSLAIIGAAYSGDARGRAIGTWAGAAALTTALGPPLGGWLVDSVSWRAIFFINVPIAAIAWVMTLKIPADRAAQGGQPLDLAGTLCGVLTLGLMCYGLIALGQGERAIGLAAIAAAAPAALLFVRLEARSAAPVLPLPLFQNRAFAGINALTVLLYAALSGGLFLLPFLLVQTHGFSATAAGATFLPFSVIMGAGSRSAGGLVKKFGPRAPLVVGSLLSACGYVLLGASGGQSSYWTGLFPGLVVLGIGMTIAVAPLTTAVFDSAPKDQSGAASGINNAAARIGGLIAVAALGLAFGGTGAGIEASELPHAYRIVMFAAAGLAAASAATAWLTTRGRADPESAAPRGPSSEAPSGGNSPRVEGQ